MKRIRSIQKIRCHISTSSPTASLTLTYLFSAETVYEKLEIHGRRLIYTAFADKEQRCAQAIAQAPCWRKEDLTTRAAVLSPHEEQALVVLLEQVGFWQLDETYGMAPPGQRFYPYHLSVHLGDQEKAVVYQSFPAATPMQTAFRQVMDQLETLVNAKFRDNR